MKIRIEPRTEAWNGTPPEESGGIVVLTVNLSEIDNDLANEVFAQ